jgi:hypothetical protein
VSRCALPDGRLTVLGSARFQWDEGHRRLEAERADAVRHLQLVRLRQAVIEGLRRRLGASFTLEQLGAVYERAEDWAAPLVAEALPAEGARVGLADVALVLDAAFHAYARGALDFEP